MNLQENCQAGASLGYRGYIIYRDIIIGGIYRDIIGSIWIMEKKIETTVDPTLSQAHVELHSCPKCNLQVLPLFEQYSAQHLASASLV